MASDKARTQRIQRVYGSRDYDELTSEYNGWASEYDADLRALGFSGPRAGAEALARHVADKGAQVLDAVAGTGMVGAELARLGFRHITALDLSPGMLKTANEKLVYEELVVGELGKPLGFETGRFDATTCIGTLTIGHAPPESLDELVRVTKAGGAIVFSMRTDYLTEGGFDAKQAPLEEAGRWRLLERGAPFQPMPHGEPDIWYEIWGYEVLPPSWAFASEKAHAPTGAGNAALHAGMDGPPTLSRPEARWGASGTRSWPPTSGPPSGKFAVEPVPEVEIADRGSG